MSQTVERIQAMRKTIPLRAKFSANSARNRLISLRLGRHLPRPIPPISSPTFGIIQEKLHQEPFWLLIATTFLNQTSGRAAVPVFWALKNRFPTPDALAQAEYEVVLDMIRHLGLQRQRAKRVIAMAKCWRDDPPRVGRRFRTKDYPGLEGDTPECKGSLEIGHIPGCGRYAYDSWRIFCRDVLRGVAEDYNGKGAIPLPTTTPSSAATLPASAEALTPTSHHPPPPPPPSHNAPTNQPTEVPIPFEPEWKRVLPQDKELIATLRWMWLREGWIWDPSDGAKRPATLEEMERARKGEMEVRDPKERKFAERAARGGGGEVNGGGDGDGAGG
ncbi:hypothetical protein BTJ68_13492 [Hortaea werneckii EXF-2000]|uniref:HhH-GPD domain-containing protein n=1 Tax=Hortaea werneckii EXF-2000 TaxID=1157616 RepID=A0A1Z5STM7_HORWE|nr:hypothetical protein BTJ68_13492 [Hortaea werneckii EXF-2000]